MKKLIIFIAIICVMLDQITKFLIVNSFSLFERKIFIDNFFYFTYVKNDGAAWSILSGNRLFLILITLLALIYIIKSIFSEKNITTLNSIAYGMLLGGIFGNFIDRIFYGYVIDFIGFILFKYYFPVFNIADILIVVSVFLMIISFFRGEKNENIS